MDESVDGVTYDIGGGAEGEDVVKFYMRLIIQEK